MNIQIEIASAEVETRSGVSTRDGKQQDWRIREQKAYLKLPHFKYPQEISIRLEGDNAPYAEGSYSLASESFYIDKFRKLQIGRLNLEPIAQSAKPAPIAQAVRS